MGQGTVKPLAIDLFCGLGGWAEGLLAEGYSVVGFDIERHDYGTGGYPSQLVLQDVLTLDGAQFKDAALIVASPPCTEFSYLAMPWSRGKQIGRALRGQDEFPEGYAGSRTPAEMKALFYACFRIQIEASHAASRYIPLIIENVRGAQPWVGRSRWHYGSFHLWGDVPALMPITSTRVHKQGIAHRPNGETNFHGIKAGDRNKKWFNIAHNTTSGVGNNLDGRKVPIEGTKQGGDWFNAEQPSMSRLYGSKSPQRKAASAMIARIPFALSRHIARVYKP